jgi:acetyl esterase
MNCFCRLAVVCIGLAGVLVAADTPAPVRPSPNHGEIRYGPHERHVFDFWLAPSDRATPLAVYIHGGGSSGGNKDRLPVADLRALLEAGISVASLHYRFLQHAKLPAAHHDVARAVQFLRHHSGQWRLDPARFAAFGGSAGAQLAMFLAFHDDLADPESNDPVARRSTRVLCVAAQGGQGAMDMEWMDAHIPGVKTRPSRLPSVSAWNEKWYGVDGDAARRVIAKISAVSLLSRDDPPLFLSYGMAPDSEPPEDRRQLENWISHHVAHGVALRRRAEAVGVEVHLRYPGARAAFGSAVEFLRSKLLDPAGPSGASR